MKRRNFLKGLLGIASAIIAPRVLGDSVNVKLITGDLPAMTEADILNGNNTADYSYKVWNGDELIYERSYPTLSDCIAKANR